MLTLISTILVIVGTLNWFTIGALQYDFVAGLFGSQANIFSRIVYVLVGIAGIFLAYSIIRNKGRLVFKNKSDKALFNFNKKAEVNAEASHDNAETNHDNAEYNRENMDTESASDNSISNDQIQSRANRINDKNRLSTKHFYTESARDNSQDIEIHESSNDTE